MYCWRCAARLPPRATACRRCGAEAGESPLARLRVPWGARYRRALIIAATAVCVLAVIFAGARYLRPTDLLTLPVPEVVSLTRSEAEAAIRRAGLSPAVRLTESSEEVLWDRVLQQSPLAGMRAARGQEVRLLVAVREQGEREKGPPLIVYPEAQEEQGPGPRPTAPEEERVALSFGTPQITGRSWVEARRMLRAVGLGREIAGKEFSDAVPRGYVLRQDPAAGEAPPADETVRVVLSYGRAARVPRVMGRTRAEAAALLEKAGLRAVVARRWDQATAETVVATHPRAGTALPRGERVTLVVSRGPRPTEVTATEAALTIYATPSSCTVWVYVDGGSALGKCPCTVRLRPGQHIITLWDTTHLRELEFRVTAKAGSGFSVRKQVH